jgi:hypothetical protein
MPNSVACPLCGHTFQVALDSVGSMVRCPHCAVGNWILSQANDMQTTGKGKKRALLGLLIRILAFCLFLGLMVALIWWSIAWSKKEEKLRSATADVNAIAEQARTYQLFNDEPPPDVMTMTRLQGPGPFVPPEHTIDPWGKLYQIKVEDGDVVVFTTTPDGKEIRSARKKR